MLCYVIPVAPRWWVLILFSRLKHFANAKQANMIFGMVKQICWKPHWQRPARLYTIIGSVIFLIALGGVGLAIVGATLVFTPPTEVPIVLTTASPPPVMVATVTIGPPTATVSPTPTITPIPSATPTREPCVQVVQTGDSLSGVVARCGHFSRDILEQVVADNALPNANSIVVGQQLVIPWPTPSPDPNALPTSTPESSANLSVAIAGDEFLDVDESLDAFAPTATPTLPSGVMWHQMQPNENLSVLIVEYQSDVKTLSDLNPEIDFSSCDFGPRYGGDNCVVVLSQGQLVRVPAPTPTMTLSPTIDPFATSTPTPTATINVPVAESPPDRAFFGADELVTLRWVATGSLSPDEVYRVDIIDTTAGIQYTALTRENTFMLPPEWRGTAAVRHEFTWTTGIVNQDTPDDVRYPTGAQTFVWQGIVESEEE